MSLPGPFALNKSASLSSTDSTQIWRKFKGAGHQSHDV
jgi:hypothetical protein